MRVQQWIKMSYRQYEILAQGNIWREFIYNSLIAISAALIKRRSCIRQLQLQQHQEIVQVTVKELRA